MLCKPHRILCEKIITSLSDPHPRSSLETAGFNASHPRVKAQIQEEIARLVAIGGPAVSARFQN